MDTITSPKAYYAEFGEKTARYADNIVKAARLNIPSNGVTIRQLCAALTLLQDDSIKRDKMVQHFIALGHVYEAPEVRVGCHDYDGAGVKSTGVKSAGVKSTGAEGAGGENGGDELMASIFLMASHEFGDAKALFKTLSLKGLKPGVYARPLGDALIIAQGEDMGSITPVAYGKLSPMGQEAVKLIGLMRTLNAITILDKREGGLSTQDIRGILAPIRPFFDAIQMGEPTHSTKGKHLESMFLLHFDALEQQCTKRLDESQSNVLDLKSWQKILAKRNSKLRPQI